MNETAKILVIDDEEVIHASIKKILSRFGYQVVGALSAGEGLERMATEEFDAVITDLMMPEMNGLEMLNKMKERGLDLPSIMITGYPTIKTAIQALRLGAVDYLPKPFTRKELLTPLLRTLRRAEAANDESVHPQPSLTALIGSIPPAPGDCFYLPGHSWAYYDQDGTVLIGVEASFLSFVPPLEEIRLPLRSEMIEQGHPGLELAAEGEVHCVFMPLTGQVVEVNEEVVDRPAQVTPRTWLVRILPSQLSAEVRMLQRKEADVFPRPHSSA